MLNNHPADDHTLSERELLLDIRRDVREMAGRLDRFETRLEDGSVHFAELDRRVDKTERDIVDTRRDVSSAILSTQRDVRDIRDGVVEANVKTTEIEKRTTALEQRNTVRDAQQRVFLWFVPILTSVLTGLILTVLSRWITP